LPISLAACLAYIYPIVCSIASPKAATWHQSQWNPISLWEQLTQGHLLIFEQEINKAYQPLQAVGPQLWPIV
jgi:hypothetical protein